MRNLIILLFLFFPFAVYSQTACPLGVINDPSPGACGSYVDQNRNALCDLSELPTSVDSSQETAGGHTVSEEAIKKMSVSEVADMYGIDGNEYRSVLSDFLDIDVSLTDNLGKLHDNNGLCAGVAAAFALDLQGGQAGSANEETDDVHDLISGQELKQKTVAEVAALYKVDASQYAALLGKYLGAGVTTDDSFQVLHDNLGLEPSIAKDIASGLVDDTIESLSYAQPENDIEPRYRFFSILIALALLYLITWLMVEAKKISLLAHRRLWNLLLLLFFLLSALSGVFLVILINYGWGIAWPFNLMKVHVETGIAMVLISFFHIAWHWNYFVLMFKKGARH